MNDISEYNSQYEVIDNILSFPSTDILQNEINQLKNEFFSGEVKLKLQNTYHDGFLPLKSQSEDIELNKKILSEKSYQKFGLASRQIEIDGETYELDDDLILDDEFASFLNVQREIIVNDTLYNYTTNGIYKTHVNNISLLRDYIASSDLQVYETLPNPGIYDTENPKIKLLVPDTNPCDNNIGFEQHVFEFNEQICYYNHDSTQDSSGSTNTNTNNNYQDYTLSLREYSSSLEPCSQSNNFLGIFGPDRRCWSYFDNNRRTKTVFWKHNYFVYKSVGVKVKHQKRHNWGWWYASETDEVALLIDKAYFKLKPETNPMMAHNVHMSKTIFFNGNVYNSVGQLIAANSNLNLSLPSLPLNAEFIVADFVNNTTGISLSPNQVKNFVYQQTWSQLTSIIQNTTGTIQQPKSVNYYLYDSFMNEIHFLHINTEERRLNRKKLVRTFDINASIQIKFNFYGIENTTGNHKISTSIDFPGLFKYKDADIDFIGVTRRNDTWRGSKLVFKD